jgi:DNA replication protein DnaC
MDNMHPHPELDRAKDSRLGRALSDKIAKLMTAPVLSEEEADRRERRWSQSDAPRCSPVEDLRQRAGRYADATFENWRPQNDYQAKVLAAVREWAADWPKRKSTGEGLVLYGPVGTGKDHLAYAAAFHVASKFNASVRTLNGRSFFGQVRDRMEAGESERELIDNLTKPDLLLLSDPAPPIGELTPHQADMLYRVIESRYFAKRVTACTLNVASDEEADRILGAATWDRLCHGAWKIACPWESYRKAAKEIKP